MLRSSLTDAPRALMPWARALAMVVMLLTLTGCAVMAVSAVVVTASAVHDRRSVETVVDDQRLSLAVRQTLNRSNRFAGKASFDVSTYNGWVLLTGEVETADMVEHATALISDLSNVRRLFNELEVGPTNTLRQTSRDGWISLQVKAAIADIKDLPGFDASHVKITTRSQVVYLQGLVSEQESARIVDQARQVRGVDKVVVVFELMPTSD